MLRDLRVLRKVVVQQQSKCEFVCCGFLLVAGGWWFKVQVQVVVVVVAGWKIQGVKILVSLFPSHLPCFLGLLPETMPSSFLPSNSCWHIDVAQPNVIYDVNVIYFLWSDVDVPLVNNGTGHVWPPIKRDSHREWSPSLLQTWLVPGSYHGPGRYSYLQTRWRHLVLRKWD